MHRVSVGFALTGAVVTWVLLVPGAAVGDPPASTRPTTRAATWTTTAPDVSVTVSSPVAASARPRSLADRLGYTDNEKTVLGATRDGVRKIDETGLYVTLGVAARAAGNLQFDRDEWSQLDRPAYTSLLTQPKRWRGHPLELTPTIFRVTKMTSGKQLNYSNFWPKDRPVWRLDGVIGHKTQPVIIYSVVNPSEYLGQGKPGKEEDQTDYNRGQAIRAAAIFYKDVIDTDCDGATRHYPLVMAWQLSDGDEVMALRGSSDSLVSKLAPVAILLVVMAAGFYYLRRWMTQSRQKKSHGPRYKPLRDEIVPAAAEDNSANSLDEHVDPELAAAIEQYRHEKGLDESD